MMNSDGTRTYTARNTQEVLEGGDMYTFPRAPLAHSPHNTERMSITGSELVRRHEASSKDTRPTPQKNDDMEPSGEFGFVDEMLHVTDFNPVQRMPSKTSGTTMDSFLDSMEVPQIPDTPAESMDQVGSKQSSNDDIEHKSKRLQYEGRRDTLSTESLSSFSFHDLNDIAKLMGDSSHDHATTPTTARAVLSAESKAIVPALPPHLNNNRAYSSTQYKALRPPASVGTFSTKSAPSLTLEDRLGIRRMLTITAESNALHQRSGTLWSRLTAPAGSNFIAAAGDLIGQQRGSSRLEAYQGETMTCGHVLLDALISGRGELCPDLQSKGTCCVHCEHPVYRRLNNFVPNSPSQEISTDWAQRRHTLGLVAGEILELCGATGSGKSQLCHQLALSVAAFPGFHPVTSDGTTPKHAQSHNQDTSPGSVLYIDSGPHFSGRRLVDMARTWAALTRPEHEPSIGETELLKTINLATKTSEPARRYTTAKDSQDKSEMRDKSGASPELYASPGQDVPAPLELDREERPTERKSQNISQSPSQSQRGSTDIDRSKPSTSSLRKPFSPFYRHVSPRGFASSRHRPQPNPSTELFGTAAASASASASASTSSGMDMSALRDTMAIEDAFHSQSAFNSIDSLHAKHEMDLSKESSSAKSNNSSTTRIHFPHLEDVLRRIHRYEATNLFQLFTILAHAQKRLEQERHDRLKREKCTEHTPHLKLIIIDSIAALLAPLCHTLPTSWQLFVSTLGLQLRLLAKEYGVAIVVTNSFINTYAPNLVNYMRPSSMAAPQNLASLQNKVGRTMIKAPALGTTWHSVCDTRLTLEQTSQAQLKSGHFVGKLTVARAKHGEAGHSLTFTIQTAGIVPLDTHLI